MNSNIIPASALKPQFTLTAAAADNSPSEFRLIGQSRVRDAFKLLSNTRNQHMYLADYSGCNRKNIIRALIESEGVFIDKSLVLRENTTAWCVQTGNQQVLASKQASHQYLSGSIKRHDLVGRYDDSTKQYKAGALANCHYLFICADSIWKRETLWELLLEILDKKEYQVHSNLPPLALNCKIILIGSSNQYGHCWLGEPSFSNLFPLLGELLNEVDLNEVSLTQYNQ